MVDVEWLIDCALPDGRASAGFAQSQVDISRRQSDERYIHQPNIRKK
jgi:hypothetical protein